jgi:PAT family acetyl-CoA transporter-like MFS transporter 1
VTAFFFVLYFLMATQDIAVDGWALTMLSKKNRGRGPVCNSIGQNIGYFLSFVGFLALNDAESSETLWRPLLRLPSHPGVGLVSLGTFIRSMGYFMLLTTTMVAWFKREVPNPKQVPPAPSLLARLSSLNQKEDDDQDGELDAAELGLKETYHRLWAVCQLPSVRWLFLMLVTYRLPTALSDNVKFLKAVEFGMSKSTTALLSPTLILPLGILVPLIAAKVWHGHPLQQFTTAFKLRVTLVPMLDMFMLKMVRHKGDSSMERRWFWMAVIASTAASAICNTLQFNSQMIFFASRVDPAIGGSYMTLLNTAANLGGTWPASFVMWLIGKLTRNPICHFTEAGQEVCTGGNDPYFFLQLIFSGLGIAWILLLGKKVQQIAALPDEAWRTHLLDSTSSDTEDDGVSVVNSKDVESGVVDLSKWTLPKIETKQE